MYNYWCAKNCTMYLIKFFKTKITIKANTFRDNETCVFAYYFKTKQIYRKQYCTYAYKMYANYKSITYAIIYYIIRVFVLQLYIIINGICIITECLIGIYYN